MLQKEEAEREEAAALAEKALSLLETVEQQRSIGRGGGLHCKSILFAAACFILL